MKMVRNGTHKKFVREQLVLHELSNPDNWKPNLTQIAKKLKISVSTVHSHAMAQLDRVVVDVRVMTEKQYFLYLMDKEEGAW